mmetsp:Transcript_65227/g.181314  ORF Transcript_65227/g.181314 Transcript_65227/m.181314 type:complete len:109 (-) Transcript_65227:130-456(-)
MAGHVEDMRVSTAALIACVGRHTPTGDASAFVSVDDARAARLATSALMGLATDPEARAAMQATDGLQAALQQMSEEEPAARDLLDALSGAGHVNASDMRIAEAATPPF